MLEGWFFIVSLSIPVIRRVSSTLQSKYSLLYSWFAVQIEDAKPKGSVASLDGVPCGSSQVITFRSFYSSYCPIQVICNHRIGRTCCSSLFFSWILPQPPTRPSMDHTGRWLLSGNSTCFCH